MRVYLRKQLTPRFPPLWIPSSDLDSESYSLTEPKRPSAGRCCAEFCTKTNVVSEHASMRLTIRRSPESPLKDVSEPTTARERGYVAKDKKDPGFWKLHAHRNL